MKKIVFIMFMISLFLFTAACGAGKATENEVEAEDFALDTIINQVVYGENAQAAADAVSAEIKELDDLWSVESAAGDTVKLNNNAGRGYVELDPKTIALLQEAQKISDYSDGAAFDITVAPIVNAWGVCGDDPRIPPQEEIASLLPLVNYEDVLIDAAASKAALRQEGQMIDLGGIAKGYIGDLAIERYKEYGVTSAFINLGGNVVVLGNKPDGTPWKVGIQDPRGETSDIIGYVEVSDQAVVTSGDYQRYFIEDHKRYCHIIDPRTGYPIDNGLMSVTVITASSADADGLAKAIVLGLDEGMALIEKTDGAEAVFITTEKEIYVTSGLSETFHFEDASNGYTYIQKGR